MNIVELTMYTVPLEKGWEVPEKIPEYRLTEVNIKNETSSMNDMPASREVGSGGTRGSRPIPT